MGSQSCEQAGPLRRPRQFADHAPSFAGFNVHQTVALDSLVSHHNEPPSRYLEAPVSGHPPPASLDIHLGARRYQADSSRLGQMLHLPLEISTELPSGRSFTMPSPTNVSLLNNFPFASPDINEPGSPLGYDLNSSLLDSNLENFSNSLLDINETADAGDLNFSPSSDLNLSPQESPIFQLFTGPSLELALPSNPEPAVQNNLSKANTPTAQPSLSLQGAPLLTPPPDSSPPPRDSYAELSVAGIIQQKKDDVFWAAWFFFSHFFEPVRVGGAKDLRIALDQGAADAEQQIDRQVFVVQNDLENMYMWYLSARPANALGRMQLQSYINGRHQAGQAAFPFSSAGGFVRSHKLQRKKYKGLSNPQCIHGIRAVDSPHFTALKPEEKKRFEELTSRPLGTVLPPQSADYNAWRRVPERSEASPSVDTAEPPSQTIQFLPGQEAQNPTPKPASLSEADPPGSRLGGRAPKRRKKGAAPKAGAANGGQSTAPSVEQGPLEGGGTQELLSGGGGTGRAVNSPQVESTSDWQAGPGYHSARELGTDSERPDSGTDLTSGGLATTPNLVTDLTLRWQAEIAQGRTQMWGTASDTELASKAAELRALEERARLTVPGPSLPDLQSERTRDGRVLAPNNGRTADRVSEGREGLVDALLHSGVGSAGEAAAQQQRRRDAYPSFVDGPQRRGSMQTESRQAGNEPHPREVASRAETVSEDCSPEEGTASLDRAEVSGPSRRTLQSVQAQDVRQLVLPISPLGGVPLALHDLSGAQLGAGGVSRGSPEALYEDDMGYLLFVSLPLTDLKQVRVTWRNVGETGIVKVDGAGPVRGIARGSRVLRLSNLGRAGGEMAREIMLPTRIPDDASIEARFSAECAGLEISVPKHAACTEERPVRLFLPEQRQLPRGF